MTQERVRDEWQSVARGWRRWEPMFQSFSWPLALRMAAVGEIGSGHRVLDVGCGIGDPTLQVAVLVGPHGRVVGLDISEGMIAIARERAAALGRAEVRVEDVTAAALPDAGFDVVLGRWSLIYLEDVARVLERLRAALVPGGRIAITAWAPPDANPWFTVPQEAMARVRPVPPLDPGKPGVFHLSTDGALAGGLGGGAFRPVGREGVVLRQPARAGAEFWRRRPAPGGPLAPFTQTPPPAEVGQVAADVAARLERYRAGEVLRIPAQAQL